MIRTTIFGGSFNPIHCGHLQLARYLIREKLTDEVWLLVSPQNPLKRRQTLIDENARLRLAQAALADEKGIIASDFEFHLPRPSYTWNTLRELRKAFPERTFSLLIGADNWQLFPQWRNSEEILQICPIFIYPREGYEVNTASLPQNVHCIKAPLFPYSSTAIREALSRHKDCTEMLPDAVCRLIKDLRLYQP